MNGLSIVNEIDEVIRYELDEESALLEEIKKKYIVEFTKILLEIIYVLAIIINKGISISNFCMTSYVGLCLALLISRSWNLYRNIYEDKRIRLKMQSM